MLPDPEAQDEWQVRSCLKLCGHYSHSNSTVSIRHWCLFSGRRHMSSLFFSTICLTDLTVYLLYVDLYNIYFLGWNFSRFIAQIREALFCQVKNHRTKPHFPTLMQRMLVGQSPHLPGSLQEALAEHHWLQRLPHRPRDSRALRIAHKEGEFTRPVGPVGP